MTVAANLATLGAGFSAPALDSQAVFRVALDALSRPGQVLAMPRHAQVPANAPAAAACLLLALLDPDARLWAASSIAAGDAPRWLRFHTGCQIVDTPAQAQFAWAGHAGEMPPLDAFEQGSDLYPEQSATCVLGVASLAAQDAPDAWRLQGPGIRGASALAVGGLDGAFASRFLQEWQANRGRFPRGVDLFLATDAQIAGLPRTVGIERQEGVAACTSR
ncbi:phosphonate C-P lyase system protein PhnH [Ramlibacter sp. H39-3-26]|uniref:phosphonate C-P lyase system protein PhnH n=1 Tax=Curvibacter soli TaxID=3031331 RepID=UPI0023DB6EBD|nr:phosphonate C-P lyase system protein PhnH [Ramlibacter sp. H39-3-26]MDF1484632.1 phosphonate C-P lyase system protein PhnH [Ramlibacter sp. H39-3-26]